jgi:hypothetical protein
MLAFIIPLDDTLVPYVSKAEARVSKHCLLSGLAPYLSLANPSSIHAMLLPSDRLYLLYCFWSPPSGRLPNRS